MSSPMRQASITNRASRLAPAMAHPWLRTSLGAVMAAACVARPLAADDARPAPPSTPATTPTPAHAPPQPAAGPMRTSIDHAPHVTLRGYTKTRAAASPNDDQDLVALGRLLYAKVDVECDEATVGASIRALTDALELNVAMKFDVAFVDDTPVVLALKEVDGLTALEAIISQGGAQGGSAATWQLRRGIVEIGSREFLARTSARRTQLYDVSSLVFDVPYTPAGETAPAAIGHLRPQFTLGPDPETYRRKAPIEVAADLMQAITEQVEPEAWQPLPEGDGAQGTSGPTPRVPSGGSVNHGQRNLSTLADRNFDASLGPPFVRGKWASLGFHRQSAQLMVSAPDFVHRGIGGYPPALPVAPKAR